MRNASNWSKVAQLNLFHPPRVAVNWETLPREIQQQSVRLLARLLRDHCVRGQARVPTGEAGDE